MPQAPTPRSVDRRASAALMSAVALWTAVGCMGRPVPLVARAGTTIGLAIGGENYLAANAWLAFGTGSVADRQRGYLIFQLYQGSTFVTTLSTRYVTKLVPDPASEVGLYGVAYDQQGVTQAPVGQALALVDIPSTVLPGIYRIHVRRSDSASGATFLPQDPPDSALYELEVIEPQFDSDFTPFDHEEPAGVLAATAEQLQSVVPKPKLRLNLPSVGGAYPAAATIELSYDTSRIEIWGALLNIPSRPGVLITTEFPAADRVRIHYVNPAADGEQLALVFEVVDQGNDYDPVSATDPTHFSVINANTRYYDADGVLMSVGGNYNPKAGIR